MSEEPNPPPLRLKPRLRSETAESPVEAPATATPTPVDPTPDTQTETPRLRLKPRLNTEPTVAEMEKAAQPDPVPTEEKTVSEETSSQASASRLRLKPKIAAEPLTESASETKPENPVVEALLPPPTTVPVEATPAEDAASKFKLKSPTATPEATPTAAVPPPIPPPKLVVTSSTSPIPVSSPAGESTPPISAASAPKPQAGKPPVPLKKRRPPRKPTLILLLLLLVLILGGGGYAVWAIYLDVPEPEALLVRRPVAPAPAPAPAPANVVQGAEPQSTAGQLIAKARDAVAAHNANLEEPVNEVMADSPILPREKPPVEVSVAAISQSKISQGITATTTTILSTVEASPAFQSFVAEMRINGVFQGSPARALINGRTYNEGEIVEPTLGISFAGVEPDEKQIVFRDPSGAIVKRKY